jgi:hypothetical protein
MEGGITIMDYNWMQLGVTFAGMILGSGLIQFLITRKDAQKDKIDQLCEKIDKGLTDQSQLSQERYDLLKIEIEKGLEERENMGKARFLEHREAIQKLNEAIFQLTKNDTEQSQYMKNIGESLIGLSHDKIITLSDKFLERGAITLKEKSTLKSIYDPYQKLGGNGDCHIAYSEVCKLPIVSEERARELDNNIESEEEEQ